MNFSVIIPTYNRSGDLRNCLTSILDQTLSPRTVIVIDDAALDQKFLQEEKKRFNRSKTAFLYHRKNHPIEPRGTSYSRNIGVRMVKDGVFFILDDDVILDPDFFATIMAVWEKYSETELIGVGGVIKNNRKKSSIERIYNRLFCLSSPYAWDVNDVGFQAWDDQLENRASGYYIHGGVSSFKTMLVRELGAFSVLGDGRMALEDVDFCLRAKKNGYHFIVEPKARALHKSSPTNREGDFTAGLRESYNRRILFRDHCQQNLKNKLCFIWANIGWILRQVLIGRFKKGAGMAKGLCITLR